MSLVGSAYVRLRPEPFFQEWCVRTGDLLAAIRDHAAVLPDDVIHAAAQLALVIGIDDPDADVPPSMLL